MLRQEKLVFPHSFFIPFHPFGWEIFWGFLIGICENWPNWSILGSFGRFVQDQLVYTRKTVSTFLSTERNTKNTRKRHKYIEKKKRKKTNIRNLFPEKKRDKKIQITNLQKKKDKKMQIISSRKEKERKNANNNFQKIKDKKMQIIIIFKKKMENN